MRRLPRGSGASRDPRASAVPPPGPGPPHPPPRPGTPLSLGFWAGTAASSTPLPPVTTTTTPPWGRQAGRRPGPSSPCHRCAARPCLPSPPLPGKGPGSGPAALQHGWWVSSPKAVWTRPPCTTRPICVTSGVHVKPEGAASHEALHLGEFSGPTETGVQHEGQVQRLGPGSL